MGFPLAVWPSSLIVVSTFAITKLHRPPLEEDARQEYGTMTSASIEALAVYIECSGKEVRKSRMVTLIAGLPANR